MTDLSKVDPDFVCTFILYLKIEAQFREFISTCFSYSNEENVLKKKLKISKKNLRGVEFDESGCLLLTISKDKTFRILDTETWAVKWVFF